MKISLGWVGGWCACVDRCSVDLCGVRLSYLL